MLSKRLCVILIAKMKRWTPNQQGFTIVELTITILVLGVITLSITNLMIGVRTTQTQATYLETATHAAQREVETLRNNSYDSLTPGSNINFTSSLPTSLPSATGTVIVSQPMAGLRRVDVTVSYKSSGKVRNVKLSSSIGIIGISQ